MKIITYLLPIMMFISVLVLTILCKVPYSHFSIQGKVKHYMNALLPQGWEFFTIDPRTEYSKLNVYQYNSKGEIEIVDFRNSSSNSFFGISKINRVRSIEFGTILPKIQSTSYVECSSFNEFRNITDTLKSVSILNTTNTNLMSGTYIIQKTTPIPWAWHLENPDMFMPSKITKIYVNDVKI